MPKVEQKDKLETVYNRVQTTRILSNRPAYMPTEGKMITDIQRAWNGDIGLKDFMWVFCYVFVGLLVCEKTFEDWLLAELRKMERLEYLAKKLKQKVVIHEVIYIL